MTLITKSLLEDRPVLIKRKKEEDFRTLKVGSHEWVWFWKHHPEQQEEMLKFREEAKNA